MADIPQLEDPRGEDLKSDAKLIGINFRALRDDLQANSVLQVQELVDASGAVNLTGSATQIDSVTCTLPSGWKSMDVMLVGKVTGSSTTGTDHRVAVWLESPSSTQLNQVQSETLSTSGAFANEPGGFALTALLTNQTANATVRIVANITGGTTGSGDAVVQDRHLMALKIRRS